MRTLHHHGAWRYSARQFELEEAPSLSPPYNSDPNQEIAVIRTSCVDIDTTGNRSYSYEYGWTSNHLTGKDKSQTDLLRSYHCDCVDSFFHDVFNRVDVNTVDGHLVL